MSDTEVKPKGKRGGALRVTLPEKQEARLSVVAEAFPDRKEAVAYGRKLIKVEQGLRATGPSLGSLSKEEAERIKQLLGITKTAAP